jgi:hypothetical protein
MRYSTEWNGHKIEWEIYIPAKTAFLKAKMRLFIDGEEYRKDDHKAHFKSKRKITLPLDGEEKTLEASMRSGFYGILTQIKVDGEQIGRKYIPWFRMKNGLIAIMVNLIFGLMLGILFVYSFLFLKAGIKPIILPRLNLKEVPGIIYSLDSLGNIHTFEPSTNTTAIIYSNDSMSVRSLSKDLNSVLLVYPKGIEMGKTPLRKVYWLTLDDGEMRLLGEWPMAFPYANFTPGGNRAFFSIGGRQSYRSIVADTLGNTDIVDLEISNPSPSGDKFLGLKKRGSPQYIFNAASGEITELDTILFPRIAFVRWWTEDTLQIDMSRRKDTSQIVFIDINSFESDTIDFPKFYRTAYIRNPMNRIVLFDSVERMTLGLSFIDRYVVYDYDSLIWKTNSYSSYSHMFPSPNSDYLVIETFKGIFDFSKGSKYRIISEKGTSKTLKIEGRILFWE